MLYEDFLKQTPLPEGEPADFSWILYDFFYKPKNKKKEKTKFPEIFEDGSRNDTMFRFLCSKLTKFNTEGEIAALAQHYNSEMCKPPMEQNELDGIIANVCKYLKGDEGSLEGQIYWRNNRYEHNDHWLIPLGHKEGIYYYRSSSNLEITAISSTGHTALNLFNLLPKEFFHAIWPAPKDKVNWDTAGSELMQRCREKGIFSDRNIRGRGLWRDEQKIILHLGNAILNIQSREPSEIGRFTSTYIYQLCKPYQPPSERHDTTHSCGKQLVELCENLSWRNANDGKLLAGWLSMARLCGALKWRSHIWITGNAGTGKSTIMNYLVKPMMGDVAIFALGETTAAGLRQSLKYDSIPIIFDEAETSNEQSDRRMSNVMEFIRQCSSDSEATIIKGTAGGKALEFKASSMVCLSSIRVNLTEQQDRDRFAVLELDIPDKSKWDETQKKLDDVDSDFAHEIWSMMIANFDNVMQSIARISSALAKVKNQRVADQYAPLIAGYWHLTNTDPIPEEECEFRSLEMVSHIEAITDNDEFQDSHECLQALMQFRTYSDKIQKTVTIFDLIETIKKPSQVITGPDRDGYFEELRGYGLDLVKEPDDSWKLYVLNSSVFLTKEYKQTRWGKLYSKALSRLPKADRCRRRINSPNPLHCVGVPI